MTKHLWEVSYTIMGSVSFLVITEEKDLGQVDKVVKSYFEGRSQSEKDLLNIEYQGTVHE